MSSKNEAKGQEQGEQGQEARREEVSRDRITVGDISNSKAVAIGSDAQATVTEGAESKVLVQIFVPIYEQIGSRPEDPAVDKAELTETVQRIEQETAKDEEANTSKIERWLKFLASMAPDIFEVVASALVSPTAGVAAAIRKVVEKAQEDAAQA